MASTAQVTDKDSGAIATADDDAEIAQYITGFALYIVAAVITMVGFLLMLDSTVLATVSSNPHLQAPFCPLTRY